MKNPTFKHLTLALNLFMIFLMLFALAVMIMLPTIARWYISMEFTTYSFETKELFYYILIILYISGACAIVILNELRKIFKTCTLANPFIRANVTSLKRIGIMSFIITFIFLTKIFIMNSFLTMIVVFVFIIASLFCHVIAEVFEKAITYKEETDLTI